MHAFIHYNCGAQQRAVAHRPACMLPAMLLPQTRLPASRRPTCLQRSKPPTQSPLLRVRATLHLHFSTDNTTAKQVARMLPTIMPLLQCWHHASSQHGCLRLLCRLLWPAPARQPARQPAPHSPASLKPQPPLLRARFTLDLQVSAIQSGCQHKH